MLLFYSIFEINLFTDATIWNFVESGDMYKCCVFRPAFGCSMYLKAGQNTVFNFICFFGDFSIENKKNIKSVLDYLESQSTPKRWLTPWGDTSITESNKQDERLAKFPTSAKSRFGLLSYLKPG